MSEHKGGMLGIGPKVLPSFAEISQAARSLLSEYGFLGARIFGSYALGKASADSDLDVFVQVPAGTRTKRVFEFAYDLGEMLGVEVDAYGSHEVPEDSELYRQVLLNGVTL